MRHVVHWPNANRLIYLDEKATPERWDSRWQAQGKPPATGPRDDVVTITTKFLPRGSRVLEGGCGRANKVKTMVDAGFRAIGIDFAESSVKQARIDYPDLDIRKGDVRSLDFPDEPLDRYWSIGVIEHFWIGYDSTLAKAARVLRPRGFMFLSAPWFSPYRQYKARSGGYPTVDFAQEPEAFYQFALSREEVSAQLANHGFQILRWCGRVSEIPMKEDMTAFRWPIGWLLGSRGSVITVIKRALRQAVASSLNPYCGHSFLTVAQRTA